MGRISLLASLSVFQHPSCYFPRRGEENIALLEGMRVKIVLAAAIFVSISP